MALLTRIAIAVRLSWDSEFVHGRPLLEAELDACKAIPLPAEISSKRAEGFALYSLYPESYLEAVRAAAFDPVGPTRVIGIRSVGAPLAAVVVAGLEATSPPLTVRPVGEVPDRKLALAEDLAAELLTDANSVRFAVVDEGPGLSGSSLVPLPTFLRTAAVWLLSGSTSLQAIPGRWAPQRVTATAGAGIRRGATWWNSVISSSTSRGGRSTGSRPG